MQQREAAWQSSPIGECHVSYQSASMLRERLGRMALRDDGEWLRSAEKVGSQLAEALSPDLVHTIRSFGSDATQSALIIRGLPIDHLLPPTPYGGYASPDSLPLANAVHIGIYHLAGLAPVAYRSENGGRLFRHVVPAIGGRHQKSSHGSTLTFGFHVDNPDLPLTPEVLGRCSACPEFLSLLALRSDLQAHSSIALLDSVLADLNSCVIEHLSASEFLISRPDSFGQNKKTCLPLLSFDTDGVAFCRYDKENTTPITPRAAAALIMFEASLERLKNQISTVFLPGDLLIIRNQRTLHRREGYQPRDDGADRWLVRLFGIQSNARLIPLSDNYPHVGVD
ncbi:TauD/TfdA family dioxygenase [Halomonas sp. THAF12]|uniref:TauD/TfdA family dioxygenase n=1 Tax=Halomonas sp. B23F22_10 TaxID=3459515 RepID=UPI00373E12C4